MSAHRKQEQGRPSLNVQLDSEATWKTSSDLRSSGGLSDPIHDVLQLIEVVEEGDNLRVEPVRVDVDDGRHLKLEGSVVLALENRLSDSFSFLRHSKARNSIRTGCFILKKIKGYFLERMRFGHQLNPGSIS